MIIGLEVYAPCLASEHPDIQQRDVSQHLQLADGAQVLDSVFVVELVESVNGHPEVLQVAQHDNLQGERRSWIRQNSEPSPGVRWDAEAHLKVLPRGEGEGAQVHFLGAPALGQEGVPDKDAFLQTRAEMKSDVVAAGVSQINAETEKKRKQKAS